MRPAWERNSTGASKPRKGLRPLITYEQIHESVQLTHKAGKVFPAGGFKIIGFGPLKGMVAGALNMDIIYRRHGLTDTKYKDLLDFLVQNNYRKPIKKRGLDARATLSPTSLANPSKLPDGKTVRCYTNSLFILGNH